MCIHRQYLLMVVFIFVYVGACNRSVSPVANTPNLTPEKSEIAERVVEAAKVKLYTDLELNDNPDATFSLATGTTVEYSLGDIEFAVSRGGGGVYFYFLQPINGTKANFVSKNQPGLEGCLDAIPSLTSGNIPEIEIGNYICAITSQGYLAQLQVQDMDVTGVSKGSIELVVTTWKIPQ